MKREIDIDLLRSILRYDAETGKLYWLVRTPDMFAATSKRTAESLCAWWNGRFAGKQALTAIGPHNCRHGKLFGKMLYAHRAAWALYCGVWPKQTDHADGDRSNNRIVDLRSVSHQENMCNKALYSSNVSGCHGVTWRERDRCWVAGIRVNGVRKHLGQFKQKNAAISARKKAEREIKLFHSNHGRPPCQAC